MILAMWTIPVATGMGDIDLLAALVIRTAGQHVRSVLLPAPGHGFQGFDMAWQQGFIVHAQEAIFELVDDR